jgi:UDP-glucose 4-epimerase
VTKLAAEGLCRLHFLETGLNCVVLRTGRFFPEEDDTQRELSGSNLKANEFLNRRLTVEDAADAHVVALDRAPALGFETLVLSAPRNRSRRSPSTSGFYREKRGRERMDGGKTECDRNGGIRPLPL